MAKADSTSLPALDDIESWRDLNRYDSVNGAFLLRNLKPLSSKVLMQHPLLVETKKAIERHPKYARHTVHNPRPVRFRFTSVPTYSSTSDSTVERATTYLTGPELKEIAKSLRLKPWIFYPKMRTRASDKPLSGSERDNRLKRIGLLALCLGYERDIKYQGKPNASRLAERAHTVLDRIEHERKEKLKQQGKREELAKINRHGIGITILRHDIAAGLKLLLDDTEED